MLKEGELLSVKEAAEVLGLSPFTLRTWILHRRIRHVRLGRRVLFRKADLERHIAANMVETAECEHVLSC
jgi:excisionase family DNA binding protein